MFIAQALAMSFGLIAWVLFITFVLLHAGGGFLIHGKQIYIIKGSQANNADIPTGTKISYGRLAAVALPIAVVCSIIFFVL